MEEKQRDRTKVWDCYERGREYNNSLVPNQYRLVNTNIEFFAGNQWLHMPETPAMSRLPKPTFNIIKRIVSLFVASLTSSATTVGFEPLAYYDGNNVADPDSDAAVFATAEVQNLLEKFKFDYRIREALFDGAQTGDYCAHFYWDPNALPYGGAYGPYRGEIKMELVDGLNVMFGNPNTHCVEDQPYIILIGRDTVENLRYEAECHRKKGDIEIESIQPDRENQYQAGSGGQVELVPDDDGNGKALYCYMYYKVCHDEDAIDPKTGEPLLEIERDKAGKPVIAKDKDGRPLVSADGLPVYKRRPVRHRVTTVHVTKATRTCTIFEDIDTGLTRYPIAWGNWERQKNQYHGRALVTGVIPNQIFINSMFAMVMRHLQLLGFPKTIYNADVISQWTNDIGQAIGVHNVPPGQPINQVAYNLQPADMSNQIIATIDKAMAYTKDCLGATDAQLGNLRIDNTSALMVLQSSSEVPLENTRACLHEWVEDIGAILLDMMGTYYGERPVLRERSIEEPVTNQAGEPEMDPFTKLMRTSRVQRRVVEMFDFTQFKNLWLNVRVNVGASNYYSEIAMVQTLDNLRREGFLSAIQYIERMPGKFIPQKDKLLDELKKKMEEEQQQTAAQQTMQLDNGVIPGSDGQALGSLTEKQEGEFGAMEAANRSKGKEVMRNRVTSNKAQKRYDPMQFTVGGPIDNDKAFGMLPAGMQERYTQLPRSSQRAILRAQQP